MRRASRPPRTSARVEPRRDDSSLALSVWLRLLKAHGLILRAARSRLPTDLTLPQLDVLAQLHRNPDGLTPSVLTKALLVTAGNVTVVVDRLGARGFVERLPVPGDRRAVRLRLTPAGRARVEEALPRHRRDLRALLARLPSSRLTRLRTLLGLLNHALEEEPA
jgi:DNA-binding MarR family transcriptional regulator